MSGWISQRQAAVVLGVGYSAVTKMVARGELQVRPGPKHQPSLALADVEALAAERAERGLEREAARVARAVPAIRPPDEVHTWLSLVEVADLLGLSRQAIAVRCRRDRLPHTWSAGRRWVRWDLLAQVERVRELQPVLEAGLAPLTFEWPASFRRDSSAWARYVG